MLLSALVPTRAIKFQFSNSAARKPAADKLIWELESRAQCQSCKKGRCHPMQAAAIQLAVLLPFRQMLQLP
jgi:hypothetical protein